MRKIIAVSAGQNVHKKNFAPFKSHIRYLNYGLLGLATILNEKCGADIMVVQGNNHTVPEIIQRIENEGDGILENCECILLSIPSFYSISWCAEFCSTVKKKYNKRIIVGGRWVVDGNADWVRSRLDFCVDEIIEGFGEKKLAELLYPEKSSFITDGECSCFEHLNYKLLLDYHLYQPSIEISRGCGSKCAFCADRNTKRLPNKSVDVLMNELSYLEEIYGDFSVYFEAPHFVFNRKWCEEYISYVEARKKVHLWRCTTRVETVPLDMIEALSKTGLKIIDIGLESASPKQLIRMNKTQNPKQYLEKADNILKECKKWGVFVKLNILLFAGENYETVQETIDWLMERRNLIKGVAVSSLVYYKGSASINELLEKGALIPSNADIDKNGYIDLDLSKEISAGEAQKIGLWISRSVSDQRDYYDIKSISYFERGYTYEQFAYDVRNYDPELLPFEKELTVN